VFTRKKKVGSNSGVVKPENRLLRLLRSNDVLQGSLVSLENTDREDAYSEDQKTIRNAMLEAEYQNAKALLAFQRNERFQ
jgi:hypothetical protein